MKTLLTGAAGQLGRSLQQVLRPGSFVALDRGQLDIADLDAVREATAVYRPDVVINCAAYNAVDAAESASEEAYRGNAVGPRNLALATAGVDAILLHVSTDYVFDGETSRPYHEFDRPNPLSVYGASKLAGEQAVRSLNPRHYIVRTAWVYHPVGRNFPNTIRSLAAKGPVRVVSDTCGSPTYAPHLAEAIVDLIASDTFGTFHLAGRGGTSWFELTRLLFTAIGLDAAVLPVSAADFPQAARRPRFSELTTVRKPRIVLPPWEEGVVAFASAVAQGRVAATP